MSGAIRVHIGALSEPPEKSHPWAKYYKDRGLSRPSVAVVRAPVPAAKAEPADAPKTARDQAEISAELAAAVAAASAGMPGSTAAPFITAMQLEQGRRELRRQALMRLTWIGCAVLAALIALHFGVTRWLIRAPSLEALENYAEGLAVAVLPLYSSAQQSLQSAGATTRQAERIDPNRLRYVGEVTLRLRQPLYGPAASNGTILYRQLQQSLQVARARDLKHKLFPIGTGPEVPELPLLIQMTHRAGEIMVVRVPFEAKRFGWTWRIEPPQLERRMVDRTFEGSGVDRYARVPYIIFGPREAMADIRRRLQMARAYIVAVTREVQKSADAEAVV
ncbi:MAG: hypothetical protein WD941_04840, partial [Opitutus sp.]